MRGHRHSTIVPASIRPWIRVFATFAMLAGLPAFADPINGRVDGAGAPIAGSTVTLWAASAGPPRQLAETRTDTDGRFSLDSDTGDAMLYLTAKGGQPIAAKTGGDNAAVTMLAVIGSKPPANVVINEMTTIASVWTHAQFLDGASIRGNALSLRIAAGNVPNFVDLATGGYGGTIQDALNSGQTPTMANFATLANVLAGCVTKVEPDACSRFFAATTPRNGNMPTNTLTALVAIARDSSYQPERLFALLDAFYPVPKGKNLRPTPFMPYLTWAPSA